MSNIGLCGNLLALNMNLKSEGVFLNTKIYRKDKFHRVWVSRDENMFPRTT